MANMKKLIVAVFLAVQAPVYAGFESADKAWAGLTLAVQCSQGKADGQACKFEESLKILDERGRDAFGTKTLFSRTSQQIAVESVYTLQADGRKVLLDPADIQFGEMAGDNSGFLGVRFAKLAFKEVQVGSTLVARYSIKGPLMEPFAHFSDGLWIPTGPIRWEKVSVDYSADVPLQWKGDAADMVKTTVGSGGKSLHLETTAPVYFRAEEEGQEFALRAVPRVEVSAAKSWGEFLAPAAKRIGTLLAEPLPAKAKAVVEGVDKRPEEERIRLVLEDVRKRIRYMGDWRETVHGYVPFSLAEIESRGFGDCKDMAMTTVALLRAVGIDADVAVVRAGIDDRKPLLPTLMYLNHAIVRAHLDGKVLWLDPTSPANSVSAPLFYLQNQAAFVLHDDGNIEEALVPMQNSQRDRHVLDIDFSPEGDHWLVEASSRREGVLAANVVRDEKTQQNLDEKLAKELMPGSATVLDKTITREADNANPLIDVYPIKARIHANRVTVPSGPYQQFDFRYFADTLAKFREHRAKKGVSDFHLSAFAEDRTVRIHRWRSLEPVQRCEVSSPWIDLKVEPVEVEDGVGYRAVLAKKVNWILAAEMQTKAFAEASDKLERCTQNMQLLLKAPQ